MVFVEWFYFMVVYTCISFRGIVGFVALIYLFGVLLETRFLGCLDNDYCLLFDWL